MPFLARPRRDEARFGVPDGPFAARRTCERCERCVAWRARAWGFARAQRYAPDPFGTRISMRLLSGLCRHPLCSRGDADRRSCVHQPSAFSLPWARRAFPWLRTPSTPRRCLPKFHSARSARDKHRSTPCGPLPLSFHHARHAVFSPVTLQQSLTPLPSLCPGPFRMSSRRCWTVGPSPSTLPAVALNKSLASAAGAPVAILELRVINTAPIREWTKMLASGQF
jgi:hypothetical protein